MKAFTKLTEHVDGELSHQGRPAGRRPVRAT